MDNNIQLKTYEVFYHKWKNKFLRIKLYFYTICFKLYYFIIDKCAHIKIKIILNKNEEFSNEVINYSKLFSKYPNIKIKNTQLLLSAGKKY